MVKLSGGDKLEKALAAISKNLTKAALVQVGFLADAKYPDGTSVAMVAAIQDGGAPAAGIPPRPFFRSMIATKSPEWPEAVGDLLKKTDYDAEKTLTQMGEGIKGQLQRSILDTVDPPLSPTTLMLRKMKMQNPNLKVTGATVGEAAARVAAGESTSGVSTKPLEDTDYMYSRVDFIVKS